jgi:hypothetical protein
MMLGNIIFECLKLDKIDEMDASLCAVFRVWSSVWLFSLLLGRVCEDDLLWL